MEKSASRQALLVLVDPSFHCRAYYRAERLGADVEAFSSIHRVNGEHAFRGSRKLIAVLLSVVGLGIIGVAVPHKAVHSSFCRRSERDGVASVAVIA